MMAEKLALVVPAKMYLLCRALGQITQRSGNNYNWLSYFNRVASGKLKVMFFGGVPLSLCILFAKSCIGLQLYFDAQVARLKIIGLFFTENVHCCLLYWFVNNSIHLCR